jgi:hypothetical protein
MGLRVCSKGMSDPFIEISGGIQRPEEDGQIP